MKKRDYFLGCGVWYVILYGVMLLAFGWQPIQAEMTEQLIIADSVVDEKGQRLHLIDEHGLFSKEEMTELNQELRQISEKYAGHFVVVFVRDHGYSMIEDRYQLLGIRFLEKYEYGVGDRASAALMIVDMENRWIQMVGHGDFYGVLDSERNREEIIENVGEALREYDYPLAVQTFYETVERQYKRYHRTIAERFADGMVSPWRIGSAFVASLIVVAVFLGKHNQVKKGGAANYEVRGSYHLIQKEDNFLRATTTKRRVSSDSGRGGGGRSSSGGGYSGGGGRF